MRETLCGRCKRPGHYYKTCKSTDPIPAVAAVQAMLAKRRKGEAARLREERAWLRARVDEMKRIHSAADGLAGLLSRS